MTVAEFRDIQKPDTLSLPLQALWHDARGEWDRAHELAQQGSGRDGDWVHAYLHRKEGDEGNAGYWYARAGRKKFFGAPDEEWQLIAGELLARAEYEQI